MLATVSATADPVSTVIHQMRANWTALDDSSEDACPTYSVKNGLRQRSCSALGLRLHGAGYHQCAVPCAALFGRPAA